MLRGSPTHCQAHPCKGYVTLRPEDDEDIWHLYNLIQKEDLVRAPAIRCATIPSFPIIGYRTESLVECRTYLRRGLPNLTASDSISLSKYPRSNIRPPVPRPPPPPQINRLKHPAQHLLHRQQLHFTFQAESHLRTNT